MRTLTLATIASFFASLLAKFAADHALSASITLLGPLLRFEYATNAGVAFSITFPGHLETFLIALSLGLVLWMAWQYGTTTLRQIGFGLILGGALANIVDRMGDGLVTDFIAVGSFPIFNLADSCITVGISLLLLEMLLAKRSRTLE